MKGFGEATFYKTNGKEKDIFYIALEQGSVGDLYQFMDSTMG